MPGEGKSGAGPGVDKCTLIAYYSWRNESAIEFLETGIFTKRIQEILADEEYSLLQADLIRKPDAGKLIPGGNGLRKLRWSVSGRGKRGGMRIIYYWYRDNRQLYMIYAFKKSEQADLSRDQLRILAQYVKSGVL